MAMSGHSQQAGRIPGNREGEDDGRGTEARRSGPMSQARGTVWTERALVVLIIASLAGTVNLVSSVHRRPAAREASSVPRVGKLPASPPPAPVVAATPIAPGTYTAARNTV